MKKNVGMYDAFIRITCGLMGLSYSTARMARYPYRTFPFVIAMLSAIKVAEGVTRFCPLLAMLNINTTGKGAKQPPRTSNYPRRVR
jgi:hypothetical protein